MINVLDSIQYIMDTKKAHNEIGYIGLGIMGKPMVKNLLVAGHNIVFYARKANIIKEVSKIGGRYINNIAGIAKSSKVIFLNLPNSDDVYQVILGPSGLIQSLSKGSVIIDMSTISPEVTKAISVKLEKKGCYLIDAPVSGGEVGAINGNLSIMVGGKKKIFNKIKNLLSILGENITYIGDSGSGQVTKACNQILVAGTMVSVSEILLLAKKLKCDLVLVKKALMGGFANSKILDLHGDRMINGNYKPGFKAALHMKDLDIAVGLSNKVGLNLKGAKYSKKLMKNAIEDNYHNSDSSIINKIISKNKK
ncbi:MAG: NAD(P)-dependent oxidoreductase [Gammaproteobacteria bacterium]|nr:NAD(P)-dependent oxidoreductase [Gammaproteobacteria bacterium]MBT6331820.1 NAD(P)-dependent oxidoreductase [Gammaproteobacteria bacterium]